MAGRKVSLVGQNLREVPEWVLRGASEVVELDLTGNQMTDVAFVRDFPKLSSLVLDKNAINSHAVFPYTPGLRLLWLNGNRIDNLSFFVDRLASSAPNLTWLSLMMNPGTPGLSYGQEQPQVARDGPTMSSSTFEIHDYRCYVASRFRHLKMLDDATVTKTERSEGARLYGPVDSAAASSNRHRQIELIAESDPVVV